MLGSAACQPFLAGPDFWMRSDLLVPGVDAAIRFPMASYRTEFQSLVKNLTKHSATTLTSGSEDPDGEAESSPSIAQTRTVCE